MTLLDGVDLERPNIARIYDWYLGGTSNWAPDRAFGERAVATFPEIRTIARIGRDFLGRGVRHLARAGVDQFLDLGSGVPTVGNVHEVATSVNPAARCVYVDNEPVAVAHMQVLLEREAVADRHAVLLGDLRDSADIWARALTSGALDPARPVGLIMVGVLYFLDPADPVGEIVQRYLSLVPSGSHLLASHLTADGIQADDVERRARVREQYKESSTPYQLRTREEFAEFFHGLDLVEPGVVWLPEWHSEDAAAFNADPALTAMIGALGRKP